MFTAKSASSRCWQGGGPANENMKGVAAGDDGAIVAVGRTDGDFFPFESLGGFDFLAVKLGPDGVYSWHWQVSAIDGGVWIVMRYSPSR